MDTGLIYDFGMHDGNDTEFYLRKGFRVVAVDAMPALCEAASERFADEVSDGRLTIINAAVVPEPGPVTFYTNPNSAWGTTNAAWAERNARLGSASDSTITVSGVRASDLVAEHGVPYFAKIDVEGADRLCLEALKCGDDLPAFVSIESEKVSWQRLVGEFDLLCDMGYSRFKVVPQHKVGAQVPPDPPREGAYVPYSFTFGASGMFGEEAPGRWLSRREALAVYRAIFARYWLLGDRVFGSRSVPARAARVVRRMVNEVGWWYDTHAGR